MEYEDAVDFIEYNCTTTSTSDNKMPIIVFDE